MDDKLAKTIGDTARVARRAQGLTQEDAADAIGVSLEFYARIERGKTLPSVPTLKRMSAALQVSADALLGFDRGGSRAAEAARAFSTSHADASPAVRKVLRRVSRASPSAVRLVSLLLHELERPPGASRRR